MAPPLKLPAKGAGRWALPLELPAKGAGRVAPPLELPAKGIKSLWKSLTIRVGSVAFHQCALSKHIINRYCRMLQKAANIAKPWNRTSGDPTVLAFFLHPACQRSAHGFGERFPFQRVAGCGAAPHLNLCTAPDPVISLKNNVLHRFCFGAQSCLLIACKRHSLAVLLLDYFKR